MSETKKMLRKFRTTELYQKEDNQELAQHGLSRNHWVASEIVSSDPSEIGLLCSVQSESDC